MPAANTGLAKVAVQCSVYAFVVNQNLVLSINICGKYRYLWVAAVTTNTKKIDQKSRQ